MTTLIVLNGQQKLAIWENISFDTPTWLNLTPDATRAARASRAQHGALQVCARVAGHRCRRQPRIHHKRKYHEGPHDAPAFVTIPF
jgi:hypothetical protein